MYFIGKGGLLKKAVLFNLSNKIKINGIWLVDKKDLNKKFYYKKKIKIFFKEESFYKILKKTLNETIFSIDNNIILTNKILLTKNYFFNIHNALVQNCRGLAEICILKSIIMGEKTYGITLHRILPNQSIDSGPVIDQIKFIIKKNDTFKSLMNLSLFNSDKIFKKNIKKILKNRFKQKKLLKSKKIFTYKNLKKIIQSGKSKKDIKRAYELGFYEFYFPKLKKTILNFL